MNTLQIFKGQHGEKKKMKSVTNMNGKICNMVIDYQPEEVVYTNLNGKMCNMVIDSIDIRKMHTW